VPRVERLTDTCTGSRVSIDPFVSFFCYKYAPSVPKKLAARRFFAIRPKLASPETKSRAAVDNRRNFNVLKARS